MLVMMIRWLIASSIMVVHAAACSNGMVTGAGGVAYVITSRGYGVGDAKYDVIVVARRWACTFHRWG